jgi:peptidyl-prolyl cis-trans isomerase B (cyclophilin B)
MKTLMNGIFCVFFVSIIFSCDKKEDDQNPPCEFDPPIVFLGNDTTLSEDDSIILDAANPGSSYTWSTGQSSQTILVNSVGVYWVQVSNCAGNASDTILIDNPPNGVDPPIVQLGEDAVLSEGESIILDAGNAGAAYLWSTGETTKTITVDTTGVYWVDVTNNAGTGSDTIIVEMAYKTIKIETAYGAFRMWLYTETPLHRANFIDLTGSAFYNNLIFHRVVFNFVIQGGDPDGTGYGGPGYTIPAEIFPGLSHVHGAVGAARLADNVNPERESNGSQFYIVSNPNGRPDLNGDYTVFGFVFEGIENVYEISQVDVDNNFRPFDDVIMNSVTIDFLTANELLDQYGFVLP